MTAREFDWDVCLSFAGEDRAYVENVASQLRDRGVRVFYDRYEQVELWGKDLYEHLDDIYRNTARYCVMFVSKYYAEKLWTSHERRSAQARAFNENAEYVLPVRFDDSDVPGMRDTVGYLDLRDLAEEQLAEMIIQKLGKRQTTKYFPPTPDILFALLDANEEEEQDLVLGHAYALFERLGRMNADERKVIYWIFLDGCPAELPENKHINIDLLRRCTGFTPSKIKRLLGKLQSLGFYTSLRDDDETDSRHIVKAQMIVLEWHDLNAAHPGNATDVANAMIVGATDGYCAEHGLEALDRLDFSQLATATTEIDEH